MKYEQPDSGQAGPNGTSSASKQDPLLCKKEVARWLSVSLRSVDRLVARGLLHPVRVLGAVRFHASEVFAIVKGGAQ